MNCFHHHEQQAHAICMVCGRGLCQECSGLMATGKHVCGSTCGDLAGSDRLAMDELLSKNQFGYKLFKPMMLLIGLLFMAMAASSAWVGCFRRVDLMTFLAGTLAIVGGFHIGRQLKRLPSNPF